MEVRHFRNRLVSFVSGKPSRTRSFAIRAAVFFALLLMFAPLRVAKETAYGTAYYRPDLKTAFRSMLWLWNRSWIPIRHPLVTYFDIGWILSEASCKALERRNFLSRDPLKRRCDRAQYGLSSIKFGVKQGDIERVRLADGVVSGLVAQVLDEGHRWAEQHTGHEPGKPESSGRQEPSSPPQDQGFDNSTTATALLQFDDLCRRIGQEYFLISGTLLGAIRENGFLFHDNDIDLGIFEGKLCERLVPALLESDLFSVIKVDRIHRRIQDAEGIRYTIMNTPAIIKVVHNNGIEFDLFIHFYDGDLTWHGSSIHRWNNAAFGLREYEFLGRAFNVPADSDRYLAENYGEDWQTPRLAFDVNLDTPNLSFAGTANSLVFYAWMVARAVGENSPSRVRSYLRMLTNLGAIEIRSGKVNVI